MLTAQDDVVVPPVSVRRYVAAFPAGRVAYRMLRPSEFGLSSLGHVEALSRSCAAVWPTILGLSADQGEDVPDEE